MNFKQIALGFCLIAPIALIISLAVVYLYGALVHGAGMLDWETSIRLAIILGVVLPLSRQLDKKKA